jgi:hypothetical protein
MSKTLYRAALAATAFLAAGAAQAALPVYSQKGVINPTTYTFQAASSGKIEAYFAGETAGYTSLLGLKVNGVEQGGYGLNNHASAIGAKHDFGNVQAGDTLVFVLKVLTTNLSFFSDTMQNADGLNHIHSAAWTGDDLIPAGTYVGFEDLLGGGDKDYDDLQFVFTNVAAVATGTIPEPQTWVMMMAGFGLIGIARRRQKGSAAVLN